MYVFMYQAFIYFDIWVQFLLDNDFIQIAVNLIPFYLEKLNTFVDNFVQRNHVKSLTAQFDDG